MSLRSGKLPSLGSEDEFFDHKGFGMVYTVLETASSELCGG
jgi:hypothetical protein